MVNTEEEMLEACQKHGSKRIYDAAYAFMRNDKNALPSVGLKNPANVGEADHIGSLAFKLMSQVDKAQDLADVTIDLARIK